jgi:hypothetical protein
MARFLGRFALVLLGSVAVQLVGSACGGGDVGFAPGDAGAAEPEIRVVACDQSLNANETTMLGDYYAETVVEIEAPAIYQVQAVGHLVSDSNGVSDAPDLPKSYGAQAAPVVFGDNRIAVRCGYGIPGDQQSKPVFDSVTFIIPAH